MNGSASTALNGYSKVPLWAHDSRMPTLGWVGVPPPRPMLFSSHTPHVLHHPDYRLHASKAPSP